MDCLSGLLSANLTLLDGEHTIFNQYKRNQVDSIINISVDSCSVDI